MIEIKQDFDFKDMPSMAEVKDQVKKVGSEIKIGETLFFKENGVKSEAEYKKKMAAKGHIMKHSHIGWNSWEQTKRGSAYVYEELKKRGSYVDRFGYILDWVMGVPEDKRHLLPKGTGLIFENPDDWKVMGQHIPVQPHLGDHMIGSLNSYENVRNGLEAGVTTIGNFSHYFTYEYPGIKMDRQRTIDMMLGVGLMGYFKDQGTVIHSNVDDGFGAQFHDLANLVGWCMLERYVAEDLLGAGLSHCFGNLFSDPILRMTFNMAMKEINKTNTPGSMIYGNTIDFGMDFDRNYGALCSFSLADTMGQLYKPSGHAITVIPVTEAARVPSPDEIVQAHMTVDMMIEKAPLMKEYINWSKVESDVRVLVTAGRIFFERVLESLDMAGIDVKHAGQVIAALKAVGAENLEVHCGVGQAEKMAMRGRIPVYPTNIVSTIQNKQNKIIKKVESKVGSLDNLKVIVGSTDVHEFGKEIIKGTVMKAGAHVFDLGSNVPINEIIDTLIETEAAAVLISTFNGIALTYGRDLMKAIKDHNLDTKVYFGGLINENQEGSELPVDVTELLEETGVKVVKDPVDIIDMLVEVK